MKALSIRDVAQAVGVRYEGEDRPVTGVLTDTRALKPGCVFVALRGERFDGHDYIGAALEAGAAFAISMRGEDGDDPRVLRVADTRLALLDIAGLYRRSLEVKVVGITGSVGKTTTKEMTACVAAAAWPTLKTPANLNNEVGLSQTILSLGEEHRVAVLEMGTDGPGQMVPLSRCAAPDIAIVTAIGVSHLEQMGSREGILREKLCIREGMPDGGALLLNADDELLRKVRDERLQTLFYGIHNPRADVRALHLHERDGGTGFVIACAQGRYPAFVPCLGEHNVLDALAGFAAGLCLDIAPRRAAAALGDYRPQGMRQKMVEHGGYTVVEDCYNASPDSMRAALQTLAGMCSGKRIAVLADMLELGRVAEAAHREIGRTAAQCADILLCTGELARYYVEGAEQAGMRHAEHCADQDRLFSRLAEWVEPGDTVWLKASRGMHLERLLERLYREL